MGRQPPEPDRGRSDVEKRWDDPPAFRAAVLYIAAVVVLTAGAAATYLSIDRANLMLALSVPAVCFLGGVGALIRGYRTYRRGGTWVIWQGAAWFLLALMLATFAFPTMVYTSAT